MDDIEGYSLTEQWEHLADRFKPPSAAAITVTLTSAEAKEVHEALLAAAAYLSAEIEGEKVAGQPPLEGIGSLRAVAAEIEAGQTAGRPSGV
jgi:hypothetical protein